MAKIMFVNFTNSMMDTAKSACQELKVSAVFEQNGLDALLLSKKCKIDMIVILKDSPQLDATSLSVLLKDCPKTKDIPVIVVCSELDQNQQDICKDAGCATCIKEDFTKDELKQKILEHLK